VLLSKALQAHEHLVLLGKPGTGKSTTLQFVALCFAWAGEGWAKDRLGLDEARVPLHIELDKRLYDGQERLDRALVRWLDLAYVPDALALHWLARRRLVLLLDGLDEVPQERRAAVAQAIEAFAARKRAKVRFHLCRHSFDAYVVTIGRYLRQGSGHGPQHIHRKDGRGKLGDLLQREILGHL
jgi:hypothetical protein